MSGSNRFSGNDRLFMALTALVVLAPLPLASNRPWSWSLLAVVVGGISVLWAVAALRGRINPGMPMRRLKIPALLFAVAMVWGGVQCLPVVPDEWAHPIWREAAGALGVAGSGVISADPEKTVNALIRLMTYALTFGLATQLGRRRQRANAGLVAVGGACFLYAAVALGYHYLGIDSILWIPKWAYLGDATGTFVGRASFGAFMGIGVLVALALAVQSTVRDVPTVSAGDRLERFLARTVPWFAVAVVATLALLASHSRGAFLSTGLGGLILLLALVCNRQIGRRASVFFLLLLAMLLGGGLLLAGDVLLARMAGEGDLIGDRPNLLRLSWAAIQDAPFLGHGLGAFEQAFLPYRDPSLPRDVYYDYAHSTWVEVIMDLGWLAGGSLLLSVLIPVAVCVYGLFRRFRLQVAPALAVSMATLLGAHAVIDFSVQIPALGVLFSYILGLGYVQSLRSADSGSPS